MTESGAGLATRFEVQRAFLAGYRVGEASGRAHSEYSMPAEHLPPFDAAITGAIKVTHRVPE